MKLVIEDFSKPAGIREIAAALHISIGTVDRALHGRTGVSAKTRDRVMKMAATLNYQPNTAARNLRLNRKLRIAVSLPEQIASFFDPLRDGIRHAAKSWSTSQISLTFHKDPGLGAGARKKMSAADWKDYDGLILFPGISGCSFPLNSSERKPAMIYVASDAPRSNRLAAVTTDAFVSGGIAAELLGRTISKKMAVAVFAGDLRIHSHADKLRGFAATLAVLAPHLALLRSVESHDRPEQAYKSALDVFKNSPQLGGINITSANSPSVLKAAEEVGLLGKLKIVTTDLFPELIPAIESGDILASLYQRPFTQGQIAFDILARYLTAGTVPEQITRLAPHIVLRSNLSLFTSQFS